MTEYELIYQIQSNCIQRPSRISRLRDFAKSYGDWAHFMSRDPWDQDASSLHIWRTIIIIFQRIHAVMLQDQRGNDVVLTYNNVHYVMYPLGICIVYVYNRTGYASNHKEGKKSTSARYWPHYRDVIMGAMASQITSLTIVYATIYSDPDQRKHQRSASLAFVRGIHRWPGNSPHKGPVTRKMFLFDDVIMRHDRTGVSAISLSQRYITLSKIDRIVASGTSAFSIIVLFTALSTYII